MPMNQNSLIPLNNAGNGMMPHGVNVELVLGLNVVAGVNTDQNNASLKRVFIQ